MRTMEECACISGDCAGIQLAHVLKIPHFDPPSPVLQSTVLRACVLRSHACAANSTSMKPHDVVTSICMQLGLQDRVDGLAASIGLTQHKALVRCSRTQLCQQL